MPNNTENLCFYGTYADKEYLPFLKGCTGGYTCFVQLTKVTTVTEILMYCKPRGVTGIISTSIPLLVKLLNWTERAAPSLANYAGSMFFIGEGEDKIEIVFIAPLKNMTTVTYGKFLAKRYVSKLVKKDSWMDKIEHSWIVLNPEDVEHCLYSLSNAFLIAVDIETFKDNARIRCVSFSGFWFSSSGTKIMAHSYVLPLDSDFNHAVLKKLCWELKAPKVFHNGKYDINYLLRFNCIPYNYAFDTINLMHSWYSELPKTLAVTNAFCMRESRYWKDMAKTQDLQEYYHYNALDTYTTGCACIYLILSMPQWALDNYYLEFPNVFPCIMAELTGIERDMDRLHMARAEQEEIIARELGELRVMVGEPNFNPNSPKQVLNLIHLLGCKDIKTSGEVFLKKAMFRHPLNTRILGKIIKVRKARKLINTYLTVDDKTHSYKEFHRLDGTGNRILYALNPHGTDTGRLASREHHFWAGLQIQNMPRNKSVKQTLKADPGFHFFEVDLEQAESRDTAYISGDETLIDAVENSPDFHSSNAASFFGMKFEEIYDTVAGKVIRKDLRTLGKPINHGANYNMGEMVLIDEMGEEMMYQAKALLGLPKVWSLREVAAHLLSQFHKTYPGIRGTMYKGIVSEVCSSSMLKSTAVHHPFKTDVGLLAIAHEPVKTYESAIKLNPSWTRYCFGDPTKSKPQLNAYVAHPPQSLNAMTLNKAWLKVFFSITLNPKYADNVKICAQVHDSIVGQTRIGHEYIQQEIAECMEIPVTVKGYDKKIRTFTVPAGIKAGREDTNNIATYWSETE